MRSPQCSAPAAGRGRSCTPCSGGRGGGALLQSHARARRCRRCHFGPRVKAYDWPERCDRSTDAGMLVNATSLGMAGRWGRLDMPLRSSVRPASWPTWSTCRWLRRCSLPPGRAASPPLMDSACCCTRPCPDSRSGLACARGDRRAARHHRRRHRGPLMLVVGLTGSIGMGKSTVAARLRALGIARVRRRCRGAQALRGLPPCRPSRRPFPAPPTGKVDRQKLSAALLANPRDFQAPRGHRASAGVRGRACFPAGRPSAEAPLAVLEVPLLLEGGGERAVTSSSSVSARAERSAERVMQRPGMTPEKLGADVGAADAATRTNARAPILLWTPAERSPRPTRKSIGSSIIAGWARQRPSRSSGRNGAREASVGTSTNAARDRHGHRDDRSRRQPTATG